MRYAAKRLTPSDLTLFEYHFKHHRAGNQKSINLNSDVFVKILFPEANDFAAGRKLRLPIDLRVFGPDGRPLHATGQTITSKHKKQKNWRLGGGTLDDPAGDPGRYDALVKGDIAVLGFNGGIVPTKVDMYLIREAAPSDAAIHAQLRAMMRKRSMIELPESTIPDVVAAAPEDHPLRGMGADAADAADALVEEAVLGSSVAVRQLSGRAARPRTAEELQAALERARKIGRRGEALVHAHLRSLEEEGEITDLSWDADVNAVNAWDMSFTNRDGTAHRVEVKSTTNSHHRTIHVSQAEIDYACEAGAPETQIWRVSDIDEDGGVLRRSTDFPEFARKIRDHAGSLDDGIDPDGWSIDPSLLDWDEPIYLSFEGPAP